VLDDKTMTAGADVFSKTKPVVLPFLVSRFSLGGFRGGVTHLAILVFGVALFVG
jgi:hypothetical protein